MCSDFRYIYREPTNFELSVDTATIYKLLCIFIARYFVIQLLIQEDLREHVYPFMRSSPVDHLHNDKEANMQHRNAQSNADHSIVQREQKKQ